MPFKTRDVEDRLVGKFHFSVYDKDHKVYELYINQRKVVTTKISHGGREINDSILAQMAKQVGVKRLSYFKEMMLCTKSSDDYLQELKMNGRL